MIMKKYLILILFVSVLFTSCDTKEEWEQIDSKVVEYCGNWYFEATSGAVAIKEYDGNMLVIYNTAADVANEFWFDAAGPVFDAKFKVVFTGGMDNFTAPASPNVSFIDEPAYPASSVGETAELIQYTQMTIATGSIINDAGITKSGSSTDAISFDLNATVNTSLFTGVASGSSFAWTLTTEVVSQEVIAISGHRYTGYLEDMW